MTEIHNIYPCMAPESYCLNVGSATSPAPAPLPLNSRHVAGENIAARIVALHDDEISHAFP